MLCLYIFFCFFKQNTAYEMRISDWSSDVCSSDLTEQAMLSDPASAADQLAQIRALGVAVAIDDFGTGYSSLSLLARLPIDYLKIDSGFTRTIDGSDRDRIVVRAIVDLARALGLLVVAEGIEDGRQLRSEERRGGKGCVSTCRHRMSS